ncbi:three-helix bundle dimerization domain-containing protein [Nocardia callitridis]|uniref:Uncharacterized protein n=1 Tax=Nocardia callitridis TaxID=648753 RepID=A0ABP9K592_9NOCA
MGEKEKVQIRNITDRLTRRHPELPAATVAAAVQRSHADFANASVRDFVPILVERRARSVLTAPRWEVRAR